MAIIHTPLEDNDRATSAEVLRLGLSDALALENTIRQLGFTLVGAQSRETQGLLAGILPKLRTVQDSLASRCAAIDAPPSFRDTESAVPALAAGWLDVDTAVSQLIDAVAVCVIRIRDRMADVQSADPASASVIADALVFLEEVSWQLQAFSVSWVSRGKHAR
jgi:DNA-binding ferritin-like protein